MLKVEVNTDNKYDVIIGKGAITSLKSIICEKIKPEKILLVGDETVFELHAAKVYSRLSETGKKIYTCSFPQGEQIKRLSTVEKLLGVLADKQFSRSDLIVALGGGVSGDIAGFTAGIYMRGIACIQIPTTLLAAIDSSVGGKTGVDMAQGKNLVGVFKQPDAVICDIDLLSTLSENIYAQGISEAIKYGVAFDKVLFYKLKTHKFELEDLIYECVKIKAKVVENDEFDHGERQLLNFGHTFGHAIEKLSEYSLSHGEAVGIGMVLAAKFADKIKLSEVDCHTEIEEALLSYGLPVSTQFDKNEILAAMIADKKRAGNTMNLILPVKIGEAKIYSVDIDTLAELL